MKRVTASGASVVLHDSSRSVSASTSAVGGLVATNINSCDHGGHHLSPLSASDGVPPAEYPFRLSTYSIPPNYDINIEQFEEYSFARLQRIT